MGATFTNYFALYREKFWNQSVAQLFFETDKDTSPLMAMMENKSQNTGMGRKFIVPVQYLAGSSVSADFATAQAKAQGSTVGSSAGNTRWEVDATVQDAIAVWSRDSVDAIENGGGADEAVNIIDMEMRSKMVTLKKRLAIAAFEGGYGRVATITAVNASPAYIDVTTDLANRFAEGDDLVVSLTESANVLKNSGTSIIVTAVDYDTGRISLGSDPTAGTAWAVGDNVFQKGDRQNSATPSRIVATGMKGWVPTSAPGATAFFGVDRTISLSTLGGQRFNAAGKDHTAAFIEATEQLVKRTGTKPSHIICSTEDYAAATIDRDATKIVEISLGKYNAGFSGYNIQTSAGRIPVVPDVYCPQGTAYVGPFSDKRYCPFLVHNRDVVNIDNKDGRDFLRLAGSASYECRMYFRGNIVVPAPGKFAVVYNLGA